MTTSVPNLPPRFGVIGTGRMAALMMATFREAGVEVRAVASGDRARARRFADAFDVSDAHGDWAGLARRTDIDAVYVANDAAHHAQATIAALDAGKAVLCEKPFALDPVSGAQVLNAARLSGRLCMEGLWTTFLPAHRRFRALARDGVVGEPTHFHADFGYPEPAGARVFRPEAGGVLLDRACYVVALAIQIMGPVARVTSTVDRTTDGVDHDVSLTLEHVRGGRSQLAASFTALLSNAATLSGSRGMVRLGPPLLGAETLFVEAAGHDLLPDGVSGPNRSIKVRLKRLSSVRALKSALPRGSRQRLSYGPDPYLPQLLHFLDLMERGETESDLVPLSLSLDALKVLQRAKTGAAGLSLRARVS